MQRENHQRLVSPSRPRCDTESRPQRACTTVKQEARPPRLIRAASEWLVPSACSRLQFETRDGTDATVPCHSQRYFVGVRFRDVTFESDAIRDSQQGRV